MPRPVKIDVHPDAFFLVWDSGHESSYPNRYLRLMCGCAQCVSEWTGQRIITEAMIPADVHPERVDPVGNYAIQIFWSDGHATGIYPFTRLRELCPCPECSPPQG